MKTTDDITIHGSDVAGKNVTLDAGKDIHITSAENTYSVSQHQTSKGGSIGMSFDMATGIPTNVGGSVYAGKGKTEETITTHKGSHVSAVDTLTMNSGKDTDIKGSQISGNKVNADIKGNLTIESEQNKQIYQEENKQSAAGFTTDIIGAEKSLGGTSISGGANKSHTHSNYESVTEQSGIYAGREGYDVTVKGNTDLKGSVIDSNAPAEKNHLTTGTLTWNDIDNKADYKAEGKGIAYTKGDNAPLNAKGLTPTIAPTVKDEASSTTKSGVATGKVTITDKDKQEQDIKDLNRDTRNSLNKLGEIFDKAKVEERQELIGILSKEGNEAIHKISDYYGWEEGSTEKALAHGVLGAITGELSGGSLIGSAIAGGMSEYVTGYIEKKMGTDWMLSHPDVVQAISTAVGGTIGSITEAGSTGAYIAHSAAKWNYYTERMQKHTNSILAKEKESKDKDPRTLLYEVEAGIQGSERIDQAIAEADQLGFTVIAEKESVINEDDFNATAEKYGLSVRWDKDKSVISNFEDMKNEIMDQYDLPSTLITEEDLKHIFGSEIMDDINNAADFVETIAGAMGYKGIETATGRVGQIINAGQIITSDHPVESGFAFGVGTSTGFIVGDSMFRLLSRSGSNSSFIPVIAVAWVSVYTADSVNDFIKSSLEKFRIEQEQQQKQQIQEK